jgi:hypothetical protein
MQFKFTKKIGEVLKFHDFAIFDPKIFFISDSIQKSL